MSDTNHITKEYIQSIFTYKDGELYWSKNGIRAGTTDSCGYRKIKLNQKEYKTHRLIYVYHYDLLVKEIDHIDGNRSNNNITNLRPVTRSQNQFNSRLRKDSSSGIKGVGFNKNSKKWRVRLIVNGEKRSFGEYKDIDYAKFIADAMRYKLHGEFARAK